MKIQEWIIKARKGRFKMSPGGKQQICKLIEKNFHIQITPDHLKNWIIRNVGKDLAQKLTSRQHLTNEHWETISKLRADFPKNGPTATAKKFMAKFPKLKMKFESIRVAITNHRPDNINGPFTDNEDSHMLQQYIDHGMNWSKYQIPGRSATSIRSRYMKLIQRNFAKMEGKSMASALLESFEELAADGEIVTRELWLAQTLAMNGNLSPAMIRFTFSLTLQRLQQRGNIQELLPNQYMRRYPDPRQTLPKIKQAPPQPLRGPLNAEELKHVQKLIQQCKKLEDKNKVLN